MSQLPTDWLKQTTNSVNAVLKLPRPLQVAYFIERGDSSIPNAEMKDHLELCKEAAALLRQLYANQSSNK